MTDTETPTQSITERRIEQVKALMLRQPRISPDVVVMRLRCSRNQALEAIRQARHELAEDHRAVSYATATTGYTVAVEGDPVERGWSYTTRLQDISTRAKNLAVVLEGAGSSAAASPMDKRLARQASALESMSKTVSLATEDMIKTLYDMETADA